MQSLEEVHVDELLAQVLALGASELHLQVGRPPIIRGDGKQAEHELDYEAARPQHVQSMVYDVISDEQIEAFENDLSLGFAHRALLAPGGTWTFNGFAVRDRSHMAASFRLVK